MTPDDQITAILRQGRPPVRDTTFEAAVMRQIAGRVLRQSLQAALLSSAAGRVERWAAAPALVRVLEPLANSLFSGVAVLAATLTVLVAVGNVGRRAEILARNV